MRIKIADEYVSLAKRWDSSERAYSILESVKKIYNSAGVPETDDRIIKVDDLMMTKIK